MTVSAHDSLVLLALLVAAAALLVLAPHPADPVSDPARARRSRRRLHPRRAAPRAAAGDRARRRSCRRCSTRAAFFTSLRDLRTNARAISLLSVGLVLATMLTVAAVAHTFVDGLSWPVCFVIGAIVAPTDAVAATAIASRLGLPRRLVTLIEGESLINDATALVAYSFAVAAVVTGQFSLWHATWRFVVDVVGGVAIGLAVGVRDPPGAPPSQPLAHRDRDRAALGLLRLPAGRGCGRLGRARGRHGRHLRRLVHARADHLPDTAAGRRGVGDPHVPAQRRPLRARRAAAAPDPRLARRAARPARCSPTARSSPGR